MMMFTASKRLPHLEELRGGEARPARPGRLERLRLVVTVEAVTRLTDVPIRGEGLP